MSFVHCPRCHRAYDLRRQASCGVCPGREVKPAVDATAAASEAAAAAAAESAAKPAAAAATAAAATAAVAESAAKPAAPVATTATTVTTVTAAATTAATAAAAASPAKRGASDGGAGDEAELVSEAVLEVGPRVDDVGQRIAAMVEELAALVERASIPELETARRTLEQRGLRSLWGAPAGGRRLLAAGERLVAGAMEVARTATPRRLVRRLREAWSGAGAWPRA